MRYVQVALIAKEKGSKTANDKQSTAATDKKKEKAVSIAVSCLKDIFDHHDAVLDAFVSKYKYVGKINSDRILKSLRNVAELYLKATAPLIGEKFDKAELTKKYKSKDTKDAVAKAISVFQILLEDGTKIIDSLIKEAGKKPVASKKINSVKYLRTSYYLVSMLLKLILTLSSFKTKTKEDVATGEEQPRQSKNSKPAVIKSSVVIPASVEMLAGKLDNWLDVRTGGGGQSNSKIREINNEIEELWETSKKDIEKCRKLPEGEQKEAMNKVRKARDAKIKSLELQKQTIHEQKEKEAMTKSIDSGATKVGKALMKGTGKAICDSLKLYAKGAIQSVKNLFYVATLPVAVVSLGVGLAYDGAKAAGKGVAKAIKSK